MIVQCLARSIIEFACDGVQLGLAVHRQIGSFREVLAQQTVRVLVRAALPGAVRIAEVDVSGREVVQALVVSAVIIVVDEVGDRALQIAWQGAVTLTPGADLVWYQ